MSWHVFQGSQSCGIQEIQEGSDKDGASSTSGMYLPDKPSTFKFTGPQISGDVYFETEFSIESGEEEETKMCIGRSCISSNPL